jgi:hypothetical protein
MPGGNASPIIPLHMSRIIVPQATAHHVESLMPMPVRCLPRKGQKRGDYPRKH